jgi:hypothetical protein
VEVGAIGRTRSRHRNVEMVGCGDSDKGDACGGHRAQLAQRGRYREDAVLRVGAAAAGLVEVGDFRRDWMPARMEQQCVYVGQAELAADERGGEKESAYATDQGSTHGRQSSERALACPSSC